jgi:hypothetical protein
VRVVGVAKQFVAMPIILHLNHKRRIKEEENEKKNTKHAHEGNALK